MAKLTITLGYVENGTPKRVTNGNLTLTDSQAAVAIAIREKMLQAFPPKHGAADHAEFDIPRFRLFIFSVKVTICLWWEVVMGG